MWIWEPMLRASRRRRAGCHLFSIFLAVLVWRSTAASIPRFMLVASFNDAAAAGAPCVETLGRSSMQPIEPRQSAVPGTLSSDAGVRGELSRGLCCSVRLNEQQRR